MSTPTRKQIERAIENICETNDHLRAFWTKAHGWAPKSAAELLGKSRLDRQVALSHTLSLWLEKPKGPAHDGKLILAWTNLGALLEGSLKTFLSIFLEDYKNSENQIRKYRKLVGPDEGTLESLRKFFKSDVWTAQNVERWDAWAARVQARRNAVHAYREREIGTFADFHKDLLIYAEFVSEMKDGLPYPDDIC